MNALGPDVARPTQTTRKSPGTSATSAPTGAIRRGCPIRRSLAVSLDSSHHVTPMTDRTHTEEGT